MSLAPNSQVLVVVPHGVNVEVIRPGHSTVGKRVHCLVNLLGEADFQDPRVKDWYDCSVLTRVAPTGRIHDPEST